MRAAELLPSVHKLGNNYQAVILGLATQTTFAFCLYVWLAGGGGGGGVSIICYTEKLIKLRKISFCSCSCSKISTVAFEYLSFCIFYLSTYTLLISLASSASLPLCISSSEYLPLYISPYLSLPLRLPLCLYPSVSSTLYLSPFISLLLSICLCFPRNAIYISI